MTTITAERLRELVEYDPSTGVFKWRAYRRGMRHDLVVGCSDDKGYVRMKVDGQRYRGHQLAWLYVTGEWPAMRIDHRDLDKGNNRWDNLRAATNSQNGANRPVLSTNKSGFKGVCWRAREKKWCAQITHDRRVNHLGYFTKPEDAHAAYAQAAGKLHGEFARLG